MPMFGGNSGESILYLQGQQLERIERTVKDIETRQINTVPLMTCQHKLSKAVYTLQLRAARLQNAIDEFNGSK